MYYFGASDPVRLFLVKQVHEYYHSYKSTASKLRILDVGTGPVIAHTISAAPHASEIVLSEYSEANREALLQWLKNDPKSHDWTPFFKHVVVDFEGKSEEEVPIRAELVRKVVKAVVPCDVNSDPPIPTEYVSFYLVYEPAGIFPHCHLHDSLGSLSVLVKEYWLQFNQAEGCILGRECS